MHIKQFLAAVAALTMLTGSLSGCGMDASAADASNTGSGSAKTEGSRTAETEEKKLVIGTGQTCNTLDPVESYNGWYIVRFGISETLTKMNDDMTISGWLAEDDYSVSEDQKTWTFTIRDGITFSNGNPVTA